MDLPAPFNPDDADDVPGATVRSRASKSVRAAYPPESPLATSVAVMPQSSVPGNPGHGRGTARPGHDRGTAPPRGQSSVMVRSNVRVTGGAATTAARAFAALGVPRHAT